MNTENAKVFVALAVAKSKRSDGLGTKASWTTADHLSAMAGCLAQADIPAGQEPEAVFKAVLEDTYNQSAFAQWLDKKFKMTGHFQRKPRAEGQTVSELDAMLSAELTRKPASQEV